MMATPEWRFRPPTGGRAFFAGLLLVALSAPIARSAAPAGGGPQTGAPLSIHWIAAPTTPTAHRQMWVEVRGLSRADLHQFRQAGWAAAQWQKVLVVYAGQGDWRSDIGLPPMLGSYHVEEKVLQFRPRFPLEPAVGYRAVFHPGQLPGSRSPAAPLSATFKLPPKDLSPKTAVAAIRPTADRLPENLLKFYVEFTGPMSGGQIYHHIHLLNHAGAAIELPFLEIDEELWNPSMTRLTLFIDPGRIKRGVKPLEEIGPALEAGQRYTLAIDSAWTDADGAPLRATFRKTFQVGPPDRTPVDPARWKIQPPPAGSTLPLVVRFNEALDYALAQRVIWVRGGSSGELAGTIALRDEEREWSFTASRPWTSGRHELVIQTTIEDLAGNNVGKTFEVDLFEGVQRRATNTTVRLPFDVK